MVTKNLEISYLLDFYGDALPVKPRAVLEQSDPAALSLSEIADNFGITRQGVRDAIKRGEGTILELEDKVGFARRYRAVQEGIESLEQLARDINFYNNNNYAMSEDIHRAADEMLHIINRMSEA